MKRRYGLVILAGLLVCIFAMTQAADATVYAAKARGDKTGANDPGKVQDKIDEKDSGKPDGTKRSAYSACATLIQNDMFREGTDFTFEEFKNMRVSFGRAASGDENYSISDTMLYNELNDMISILGAVERVSPGNYRVLASMSSGQMEDIDKQFRENITSLGRKDSDREAGIGLNSYDINAVTTDGEKAVARQIAGRVLLTGTTIQVSDNNPLNGESYENVVALTERQISGDNRLAPEVLADKIKDVREGGNRLAIATSRNVRIDEAGNISAEDEAYVSGILRNLPMELDDARDMAAKRIIVFSYIPSIEMLAQIESVALGVDSTLNNLTPAVARALVGNI
jgi:hypothetical protein